MKTINSIKAFFILLATTSAVYAQKQPQVQQISVRAPENIKIDGKLDEWASHDLNAYNSTDRIYYVVSNDDDNLYFTIRGMGNGVAKKAIAGGMVLTLSKAVEKKSNDQITISYPLPQNTGTVDGIIGVVSQVGGFTDDPVAYHKQIDSIVVIANQLINSAVKEIGVNGIKEIPDPVISKYNEYGIKAAAQFFRMQPIIEISIPLKYIKGLLDNTGKLSYNIKLNAVPAQSSALSQSVPIENVTPNIGYALNSTDFWGEYILAKKP